MEYTPYEPIGFENGTLVTPGKINLETAEITMPVYNGKAPVNATNLNHLEQGLVNLEGCVMEFKNHSTDETVVGTWIDGKTIYRKVIDFGMLPNATTKVYDISNLNIDKCIKISGFIYREEDGTFMTLPSISLSSNENNIQIYYTTASGTTHDLVIATGTDRSNCVGYPIIEYTKTTDKKG